MDLLDEAAPFLKMAGELVDELLEAGQALGARRVLVSGGDRGVDGQGVADEQRHRFDQDRLIAFQPVELMGEPVEPLGDGGFPPIAPVRRQVGGERGRHDGGLGHAFHGGKLVEPPGVVGLKEDVEPRPHSAIPSSGSSAALRARR